jgi:hypothetical protein
MLTQEQIARLNPEQLAIAEKWDREADERQRAVDEMEAANKARDIQAYEKAMQKFFSIGSVESGRCEHDRSIMGTCAGCEELEQLLHPEFYDENGDRLPDEDLMALISKGK